MFDGIDNWFYPSAERLSNAGKWVYDRLTVDADFSKEIIFSDEVHFDVGGYVNKQNFHIWSTKNPHAYIEKSLFVADFSPEA